MEHTIAAVATPPGVGGIAVIRISGETAYEVAAKVFCPVNKEKKLENAKGYTAMFGYFLMSVFMIITGFALYSEHSQYAIFAPFRYVVEFFYWTGGNSMDIHSWHRLGMWLIGAFVIGHVYMALREDIMSDDTVISTMVNGYRSHKFGKISNKERS